MARYKRKQDADEIAMLLAQQCVDNGQISLRDYKVWYAASVKDCANKTCSYKRAGLSFNLSESMTKTICNAVWLHVSLLRATIYPKDTTPDIEPVWRIHRHNGKKELVSQDTTPKRANFAFPHPTESEQHFIESKT
jgi:hypothetical protein